MKSTISKKQKSATLLPTLLSPIICIIICICIIILIYSFCKYNEHFTETINQYDYMEPITETISDELWTILFNKMKSIVPEKVNSIDILKKKYTNFITKAEISYYLENGIFPWNLYVKNHFIDLISSIKESQSSSPEEQLKVMMKENPVRYVYSQYLLVPNMKENIQGDAYLIYSGEKKLPTTTYPTTTYPTTTYPLTTQTFTK